jgi:hypothetical protein
MFEKGKRGREWRAGRVGMAGNARDRLIPCGAWEEMSAIIMDCHEMSRKGFIDMSSRLKTKSGFRDS